MVATASTPKSSRFNGKCHSYGQLGHVMCDCRTKQKANNGKKSITWCKIWATPIFTTTPSCREQYNNQRSSKWCSLHKSPLHGNSKCREQLGNQHFNDFNQPGQQRQSSSRPSHQANTVMTATPLQCSSRSAPTFQPSTTTARHWSFVHC